MCQQSEKITIKKYANRRLYNMATSQYVTLEDLGQMIKDGEDFIVIDVKTGDEITRSILTQIIVEEEAKGDNILPIDFLKKLIQSYGQNVQGFLPSYLDLCMKTFIKNQDSFNKTIGDTGHDPSQLFSAKTFETLAKQNLELFQNTLQLFTPEKWAEPEEKPEPQEEESDLSQQVDSLQEQLKNIQEQLQNIKKS